MKATITFAAIVAALPADMKKGSATIQLKVSLETMLALRDELSAWAVDETPVNVTINGTAQLSFDDDMEVLENDNDEK